MRVKVNDNQLIKDLNNIVQYSIGFLDGTKAGKKIMLANLGDQLQELVGEFIDANARVDPQKLHHVYEWYRTGSPAARLFDIDYNVTNGGLSIDGTLTQSRSNPKGSNTPFYNKAKVMESGSPVTISPKNAKVLRFEQDGKEVFVSGSVRVDNPGGEEVAGSFEETFRMFFMTYASQALFSISGLADHLKNPVEFKKNFAAGARGGKAVGYSAGIKFISGGKY